MKLLRISRIAFIFIVIFAFKGRDSIIAHALKSSYPAPGPAQSFESQNLDYIGYVGGGVTAVAVQGDFAYIGEGTGLTVLDISAGGDPQVVAKNQPLPGTVAKLDVAGSYAYLLIRVCNVGPCFTSLRVIEITDPANPSEVGFQDNMGQWPQDIAVNGDYLYLVDQELGLRVLDIKDPAHPLEVGYFDTQGWAFDITFMGKYAYLADGNNGLLVLDISDPTQPSEVASFEVVDYGVAAGVAVSGKYAVLADNVCELIYCDTFFRVIDVSKPVDPFEVGSFSVQSLDPTGTFEMVVSEDFVFVVAEVGTYLGDEFKVIDISDPSTPHLVGSFELPGSSRSVALAGNYALVAARIGLYMIDVSNPAEIEEVGSYNTLGSARDVTIAAKYAYAADDGGIGVIDLTDPAAPVLLGYYAISDSVQGLTVKDNYVYVVDAEGMRIIDVSDPGHLTEVGFIGPPVFDAFGVAVAGNFAYVAAWAQGLRVIDISAPDKPTSVGFIDTPGPAGDVVVAGGYAYIADGGSGLRMIDVSNPENPIETSSYDSPGFAAGVAVSGNYVFVADSGRYNSGPNGLRVIDVSDPTDIFEVGFYLTTGDATDVEVSGDYAFMVDGESGLYVFDVSDPANLDQVGFFDTPGSAGRVVIAGSYVIAADGGGRNPYLSGVSLPGGMIILNYTGIKDSSVTAITHDIPDPSLSGWPFLVNVNVSAGFGIPGGVVTVTVDGVDTNCSGVLNQGEANCQITLDGIDTYTLKADYSGDKYYIPSMTSATHTVLPPIFYYLALVGD